MNLSQLHRSTAVSESRLLVESEQTVQRAELGEVHCLRTSLCFPRSTGRNHPRDSNRVGVPELKDTSLSSLVSDDLVPVWPDSDGTVKGRAIELLHTGVPIAVQTDKALYALLALVDVLRLGRAREREFAEPELQRRIADVRSYLGAMRAVAERLDRVGLMCAVR